MFSVDNLLDYKFSGIKNESLKIKYKDSQLLNPTKISRRLIFTPYSRGKHILNDQNKLM